MKKNIALTAVFSLLSITIVIAIYSFSKTDIAAEDISIQIENKISSDLLLENRKVSERGKKYWYDGTAEISSYKLSQAQYGETHEGTAVLVYVTEPFSKKSNTKADNDRPGNTSVLKLNKTLEFNTGIYPYSMMNTTFFPFENDNASLKIASSVQEWCGMTYLEMTNEKNFSFDFYSYFEGQSYQNITLTKAILEDDLWSLIRLNPELLPTGKKSVIPSMFYLRLKHQKPMVADAIISLKKNEGISNYTLNYPDLGRELTIMFKTDFPHEIIGWEDKSPSGFANGQKVIASKAELIKTIKTDYWNKNGNKDIPWRKKLGL